MYTQHPILTEKHRIVDIFADLSPVLSGWMVNVGGQPFLGLSRDVQLGLSQGSGWAIQEQSRSCCEATPSLF